MDYRISGQFLITFLDKNCTNGLQWDGDDSTDENGDICVKILDDLLILGKSDLLRAHIDLTYPDILKNIHGFAFFQERWILAPTFDVVEHINNTLLSLIPGIPNHKLTLKVGGPATLMRNTNQAVGLCNGTKITITFAK
ncbi:uncharacterized protein [Cicer arietinum]|uniref:uncharacterized protein n=1 Tax=Cicer arietinum TaxID=3827 RepID=UPI003CC61A60